MLTPWHCAALLGFALAGPIQLPAGGGERRQPEVRRRQAGEPLLPCGIHALRSAPDCRAPMLGPLAADQPLRVIRGWRHADGRQWLHVVAGVQRGWIQPRQSG